MRFRRCCLGLCGLLALPPICSIAQTEFHAKSGFFGPRARVLYSRPTLRWEVWSDSGSVTAVAMNVNDRPVDAHYDPGLRSVCFTPDSPLPAGVNKVHCTVTFDGGFTFQRDWNTPVADTAVPSLPEADADQIDALSAANDCRARLGLPPFLVDDRLDAAARAHACYMSGNHCQGHGEEPGGGGFTGQSPSARLEAYGFGGSSWEGLTYFIFNAKDSIQSLFDAPYHRIPFMQPGRIEFGFGMSKGNATADFGGTTTEAVEVSPAAGEQGVPCSWTSHETPDPLSVHPEAVQGAQTGYPIVLAEFGPKGTGLHVDSAVLTDSSGTQVRCYLNTPDNDSNLSNTALMIPAAPLKPGTEYTVSVTGTLATGDRLQKSWKFRTRTG